MTREQAEAEMVEGFLDGYDLDAPEPSANRSASYRHGFANGRNDKRPGPPRALSVSSLRDAAERAILSDAAKWEDVA